MSQIPALPPIITKTSSSFLDNQPAATIETKVFRLEKINETLLEEIVRLQGELNALRKPDNDELIIIRSQLKRITERQDQLQTRVANGERKSLEKEQALKYLLQSSRDLEKKAINNQEIMLCRCDVLESQFKYLQNDVDVMEGKWRNYQDKVELKFIEGSEKLEKLIESVEKQHREELVTMRNIKLMLETQQESLVSNNIDDVFSTNPLYIPNHRQYSRD